MSHRPTITIVEQDGDFVELVASDERGQVTVITEMIKFNDTLTLRGLHIDGPGAGLMGPAVLRGFAKELARMQGVTQVLVYGGVRTTGANPGHVPRPIRIRVED